MDFWKWQFSLRWEHSRVRAQKTIKYEDGFRVSPGEKGRWHGIMLCPKINCRLENIPHLLMFEIKWDKDPKKKFRRTALKDICINLSPNQFKVKGINR